MEALIDLCICENEIRICYAQQIIHIEIDLNARYILYELQNWNPTRRYINECSLSGDFAYDLTAHFD